MKAVDDTTRRITHAVLRHLTAGQLTVVEDGRARTFGAGPPLRRESQQRRSDLPGPPECLGHG